MSRHDKDPRKKHEPSKSDSSSDELAEQDLENLKIQPKIDESKPQESPKQVISASKGDPLNEPIAGPSGLKESRLESADQEPKSLDLGARPKEKLKGSSKIDSTIHEKAPQSMVEGESRSQSSEPGISNYIPSGSESTLPVFYQSSTGVSSPNRQEGAVGSGAVEIHPQGACFQSDSQGPQLRRAAYSTESQNTSLDCSEIRSEMDDISAEASAYPKDFPISVHEGQSTGTSDANESQNTSSDFSEIRSEMADISAEASAYPKESPISVHEGQSTGTSDTSDSTLAYFGKTTFESMDERLTQSFPEDATRRDSGSGIKSEPSPSKRKREDLRESKKTDKAIADMQRQRAEDDEARMAVSQSCPELRSSSRYRGPERSYSVGMERQESDTSDDTSISFGKTTSETIDERLTQSFPEDATRRYSGSGIVSEPSPSKRKREDLRESKKTDKAIADMQRHRAEDDEAKRVSSQSCPDLQSSSECPEPRRSYSVGMERQESSEIESRSETETSKLEEGRKPFQNPGQLKRLQQSTISSGDSFASEEARSSPSRQDPSLETKDPIPEKMETSPEKGGESAAENVDSETGETTKVVGQSTEESKRSARKSKRDPQLSSSPQSDDMQDSSLKAETSRPKKKSRSYEESEPTVPRSVGSSRLDNASTSEDDTTLEYEHED